MHQRCVGLVVRWAGSDRAVFQSRTPGRTKHSSLPWTIRWSQISELQTGNWCLVRRLQRILIPIFAKPTRRFFHSLLFLLFALMFLLQFVVHSVNSWIKLKCTYYISLLPHAATYYGDSHVLTDGHCIPKSSWKRKWTGYPGCFFFWKFIWCMLNSDNWIFNGIRHSCVVGNKMIGLLIQQD